MTKLLRNPKIMTKARKELNRVIGEFLHVRESDIARLPYLQAVIKEAFRCHPLGAFISHKAESDVEINSHIVPKDALIIVNIWAIGRDSNIWSNPDCFNPERFLDIDIDMKGQHFELIPLSVGRRMCPALPLAFRMVHLMVVYLIHHFDWKLEGGTKPEVDLKKFGLSLHKALPLRAIPVNITY